VIAGVTFNGAMDDIATGFEAVGVGVLVVGFVLGFVRAGMAFVRDEPRTAIYRGMRSFVGRTILLSVEILIAADLIRTVAVDPSIENVGVLALIVLIRTVLSFTLDVEIEGRLPWRSAPPTPDQLG
jgi:uncharacterized membrane protein